MKSRRWFSGPRLLQWKLMQAYGEFEGPFAAFPADSWFAQREEWICYGPPPVQFPPVSEYVPQEGAITRQEAVEKIGRSLMDWKVWDGWFEKAHGRKLA